MTPAGTHGYEWAATITLPPTPTSPGRARRFVVEHIDGHATPDHRDAVMLLATELVTNSVLHAGTDCRLTVGRKTCGCVRIEAEDRDPSPPQPAENGDGFADHGRGLVLVESLAAQWGHRSKTDGKAVWCEVPPSG